MIMPDILIAGRFIVLPGRNTVTLIYRLHRKGRCACQPVYIRNQLNRKIINVFKMDIGNHQYIDQVFARRPSPRKAVTEAE